MTATRVKMSVYSNNAKLRMVRAAEASGNVARWAQESALPPALLRRWQKERDAGLLAPDPTPGAPNRGRASIPRPTQQAPLPPRAAVPPTLDPELQLKLLRKLVRTAIAQGFDPLSSLGLADGDVP